MTIETKEYVEEKRYFVSGDGEVFDTAEELAAWRAMIASRLARSEDDIANGRVMSAAEAMKRAQEILDK